MTASTVFKILGIFGGAGLAIFGFKKMNDNSGSAVASTTPQSVVTNNSGSAVASTTPQSVVTNNSGSVVASTTPQSVVTNNSGSVVTSTIPQSVVANTSAANVVPNTSGPYVIRAIDSIMASDPAVAAESNAIKTAQDEIRGGILENSSNIYGSTMYFTSSGIIYWLDATGTWRTIESVQEPNLETMLSQAIFVFCDQVRSETAAALEHIGNVGYTMIIGINPMAYQDTDTLVSAMVAAGV